MDGLRVSGVSKQFPGTLALDDVSFTVAPAAVHALLGGNGSGKSTLIKILTGIESADAGVVRIATEEIEATRITPSWSTAAGVRVVHQDLGMFDGLTVAENMYAGQSPPRRAGRIDWGGVRRQAQQTLDRLGIEIDAGAGVGSLKAAQRTLVAIARALADRPGVAPSLLVLDEPTARLPPAEVDLLLDSLRRYAAEGQTILYVTHRLAEVFSIASATTVLRDGRVVETLPVAGLRESQLVEMMVGHSIAVHEPRVRPQAAPGAPALEVSNLVGGPLAGVDLTVAAGEVVGVVGLVGSGRTHLLESIFGARSRADGTVRVDGVPLPAGNVAAAVARGVSLVPEDRVADGVFLNLGIPANVSARDPRQHRRPWGFGYAGERRAARAAVERFAIRTPDTDATLNALSGGNQQKVVLARWLTPAPTLLLLDEPTQGIDVGARDDIHRHIGEIVDAGCAVLVVSSDFNELLHLADRLVLLERGVIAWEGDVHDTDRQRLAERLLAGKFEKSLK